MQQLKCFYVAVSSSFTWGKGLTFLDAITQAKFKKFGKSTAKSPVISVTQFLLREDTPDNVVENLCKCYIVDGMGYIRFYSGDDNGERELDLKQAEEFIIGTALIENI